MKSVDEQLVSYNFLSYHGESIRKGIAKEMRLFCSSKRGGEGEAGSCVQ